MGNVTPEEEEKHETPKEMTFTDLCDLRGAIAERALKHLDSCGSESNTNLAFL